MAIVKIEITTDLGETVVIEGILSTEEDLDSFNKIEQFTLQIRRELFPELQQALLKEAQEGYKKKAKKSQMDKEK